MAGHNKWSKMKRLKGALDAKRGKLLSKLAKEITLAKKTGSGSPNGNPPLRNAVPTAQTGTTANDNIVHPIKRSTASHGQLELDGDSLKWAGLKQVSMTYLSENTVPVAGEAAVVQFLRGPNALEDNDGVQNVHAGADISEELLVKIGG